MVLNRQAFGVRLTRREYRRLPEDERIRRILGDLTSPTTKESRLVDVDNVDQPLLVRLLEGELLRQSGECLADGFLFTRVHGSDIRWKGWNVRGTAKGNWGWIVSRNGVEQYREPPTAHGDIPLVQVQGLVRSMVKLGDLPRE